MDDKNVQSIGLQQIANNDQLELIPKKFKVKVGVPSEFKKKFEIHSETNSSVSNVITNQDGTIIDLFATTTPLADLCASSYALRTGGRKKRSITENKAEVKDSVTIHPPLREKKPKLNFGENNHFDNVVRTNSSNAAIPIGPRVEIIDGKIVLKESSLVIDGGTNHAEGEYEVVEEEANTFSRYSSHLPKRNRASWTLDETKRFYHVLRQCGTEFSLMQTFFPTRTRKQMKQKFFREEKEHPELIKAALFANLPLELKIEDLNGEEKEYVQLNEPNGL